MEVGMKNLKWFALVSLLFVVAGCATVQKTGAPPPAPAPVVAPAPLPQEFPVEMAPPPPPVAMSKAKPSPASASDDAEPFAVVKVFYATDRNKTDAKAPARVFGPDRGVLSYGICSVSIPRDHKMGELEAPSIWRLEFRENPEKHVVLMALDPRDRDDYFADVARRVRDSKGKKLFVFVHGYNVTFADAARRTAQMSYDLAFDGAPMFYSWPSQGALDGYLVDETNIEWTKNNLKTFLTEVVERSTADNIYLIAHSMGNRALTRAFGELVSSRPELRSRFREIILAAPDIDADVFIRDIAPQMIDARSTISLYASSKDKALLASKKAHGYPRLGDTSDKIVVLPGMDTIDASAVDTSFLGHSYFAERKSVISDIYNLLSEGKRPDQRPGLKGVSSPSGRYWMFGE